MPSVGNRIPAYRDLLLVETAVKSRHFTINDIGHGPFFSHALEDALLPGIHHETLSL